MGEMMRLQSRYFFRGELELQTALHIGGGDATLGATDSPILRRFDGHPFIPGSSLKGAFRSTVEKLAAALNLANMEHDALSGAWIERFNKARRDAEEKENRPWDEQRLVQEVTQQWPVTALLFGTPHTASRINFADAYLLEDQDGVIQRRDGVAIDRDSERAVDGLKYDYEVVAPTLRFGFEARLENPTSDDLSLTCMGLAEMLGGFFSLGGKRSAGLGRCTLQGLHIYVLDLTTSDVAERARRLQRYLIQQKFEDKFEPLGVQQDPQAFIADHINRLVQETQHA